MKKKSTWLFFIFGLFIYLSENHLVQVEKGFLNYYESDFKNKLHFIKYINLGHQALVADLLFMKSLQDIADSNIKNQFSLITSELDLATDLDPRFEQMFLWASTVSEFSSAEPDISKETRAKTAIQIMEKWFNFFQADVQGWNHISNCWMITSGLSLHYGLTLKNKAKAIEYVQYLKSIPYLPTQFKTWIYSLIKDKNQMEGAVNNIEDLVAAEALQSQIKMVVDPDYKQKLKSRLIYYYSKLNKKEGIENTIQMIQKKVELKISIWKSSMPYIPIELYEIFGLTVDSSMVYDYMLYQ